MLLKSLKIFCQKRALRIKQSDVSLVKYTSVLPWLLHLCFPILQQNMTPLTLQGINLTEYCHVNLCGQVREFTEYLKTISCFKRKKNVIFFLELVGSILKKNYHSVLWEIVRRDWNQHCVGQK